MKNDILPITQFEDMLIGKTLHGGALPLCPHCGEWSYYTTAEEKEQGYTVCPFCGGKMYMPKEE